MHVHMFLMLLLLKFKADLVGELDVTDKKTSGRACEEKAIFIKVEHLAIYSLFFGVHPKTTLRILTRTCLLCRQCMCVSVRAGWG